MKRIIMATAIFVVTGGAYAATSLDQLDGTIGIKATELNVPASPAPKTDEEAMKTLKAENVRIEAAITRYLTSANSPDHMVRVISVQVGPYPGSTMFPFSAKTEESGFSGIPHRYVVYGIYDSTADKIFNMNQIQENPGKSAAFPKKARIDCDIKVKDPADNTGNLHLNTVAFAVANLGTPKAELLSLNPIPEDDYPQPIIQGANNQEIQSMNDQGGQMFVDKDTITLFGDSDGCSEVFITLYKDAGYTRGWAKETGSDAPNWYTNDVVCKVSEL